jgi:hypothetical protein
MCLYYNFCEPKPLGHKLCTKINTNALKMTPTEVGEVWLRKRKEPETEVRELAAELQRRTCGRVKRRMKDGRSQLPKVQRV